MNTSETAQATGQMTTGSVTSADGTDGEADWVAHSVTEVIDHPSSDGTRSEWVAARCSRVARARSPASAVAPD